MEGQVKINIGTIRQLTIVDSVDGFDDFGSPQFQRPPDQAPTVSDADVTPTSARVRLPEPGALPTPAVDVRVVTSQAGAQPGGRKEQPARHCSWKDDSSAPRFTPGNLDERRGTIDQLLQSVQPPGDTVSPEQSRHPCSFSDSMAAPSRDTPAHPAMLKKRSLTSGLLRRASTVSLATVKFQNPTLPQVRKPSATFLENRRMGDKTSWKPHLKGEGSPDFGSELPQNQTWRKMRAAKAFSRGTGLVSPGSPAKTAAIGEVLHQLSKKKFSVGKMQKKDFGEQMRFAKNQKLQGKDAFYTAKAPEYDYDAVHSIPMRDMREMLTTTPQNLATDTPEAMNRMHSSGHLYPIPASLLLENLRFIFVLAVVGGVVLGLLTLNLGDPTSEEAIASAHQATPNWEGEGCAGAAVVHGGSVHVAEHGAHAGSEHGAHDEHGRALDEHGGEHGGGHGHGDTGPVDAQSSIGIVIFLVVLTLLFEAFKDWLEELVPDQMEPVLRQIFAEFTVLGFLAMVTYFMIQGSVLSSLSFLIYQDHQHLVHLFENIHFGLFFVMLSFLCVAIWLMWTCFTAWIKWVQYERFGRLHSRYVETPEARALPLGAHVHHAKRGHGVIVRILHDGRRLVKFKNNEFLHRYAEHQWPKLKRLGAKTPTSREYDVSHAPEQYIAAVEVLHQQQMLEAGSRYSPIDLGARLLAWFRLREARTQLQYALIRERFCVIPMSQYEESPGSNFELHDYLLRACCELVKRVIKVETEEWLFFLGVTVPLSEIIALNPGSATVASPLLALVLLALSLFLWQHLANILGQLTPCHPLLQTGNKFHRPGDPHEDADGYVQYRPLPPYLRREDLDIHEESSPSTPSKRTSSYASTSPSSGGRPKPGLSRSNNVAVSNLGQPKPKPGLARSLATKAIPTTLARQVTRQVTQSFHNLGLQHGGSESHTKPKGKKLRQAGICTIIYKPQGGVRVSFILSFITLFLSMYLVTTMVSVFQVDLQADGYGPVIPPLMGLTLALLVLFVVLPEIVYHGAFISCIEMMRNQSAVDMVQRGLKLKQGVRVLKLLLQLRTFTDRQTRLEDKRKESLAENSHASGPQKRSASLTSPSGASVESSEASIRESPVRDSKPGGKRDSDDATAAYMSDAARLSDWEDVFDMLDMVEEEMDKELKEDFHAVFTKVLVERLPDECSILEDEGYIAKVLGGDETLHLHEFAFFMVHQRCCPEFFVPGSKIEKMANGEEADNTTKEVFLRIFKLFVSIRAKSVAMQFNEGEKVLTLEKGLSFTEFYSVLVEDERLMEKEHGEHALAHGIFHMIDSVVHVSEEDEFIDDGAQNWTGSKDDTVSRDELKLSFEGVPKYEDVFVDDFVNLFSLNSNGEIEFHDFFAVLRELRVLVHH